MKKRSILIELTPLLDVVLLMLFFVLVQSQGRIQSIQDETTEAIEAERTAAAAAVAYETAALEAAFAIETEAFMQSVAEEMDALRQGQVEFHALLADLEHAAIILVTIAVNPIDRNIRQLLVDTPAASVAIELSWDDYERTHAAETLNRLLADATEDATAFVVFTYDSTNIFELDYRLVRFAISSNQATNPRLFYAARDIRS